MRKEEFYFESRDNISRIHAVRYTPDGGDVKGVVQIVHGMAEYVERYEEFAAYLTRRGYVVTGEDHLGHGKSVGENGFGYFCEQDPATVVVRDVHRLKKMTEQLYPTVPYVILGHSMGSFILRNYLCRYGTGIEGAIIMGTGMQPAALIGAAGMLAKLIRRMQKTENLEKIPVKLPVLVVSGSDDPVGEYGEGVRRAAASMKTVGLKQLTCKLYPGARHELLNETDREAVMKDLVDWIEADV